MVDSVAQTDFSEPSGSSLVVQKPVPHGPRVPPPPPPPPPPPSGIPVAPPPPGMPPPPPPPPPPPMGKGQGSGKSLADTSMLFPGLDVLKELPDDARRIETLHSFLTLPSKTVGLFKGLSVDQKQTILGDFVWLFKRTFDDKSEKFRSENSELLQKLPSLLKKLDLDKATQKWFVEQFPKLDRVLFLDMFEGQDRIDFEQALKTQIQATQVKDAKGAMMGELAAKLAKRSETSSELTDTGAKDLSKMNGEKLFNVLIKNIKYDQLDDVAKTQITSYLGTKNNISLIELYKLQSNGVPLSSIITDFVQKIETALQKAIQTSLKKDSFWGNGKLLINTEPFNQVANDFKFAQQLGFDKDLCKALFKRLVLEHKVKEKIGPKITLYLTDQNGEKVFDSAGNQRTTIIQGDPIPWKNERGENSPNAMTESDFATFFQALDSAKSP